MAARNISGHRAAGGEVYFWDESGFRADTVHGKTWGVKGQTPVVDAFLQAIAYAERVGIACVWIKPCLSGLMTKHRELVSLSTYW